MNLLPIVFMKGCQKDLSRKLKMKQIVLVWQRIDLSDWTLD